MIDINPKKVKSDRFSCFTHYCVLSLKYIKYFIRLLEAEHEVNGHTYFVTM